MIPEVTELLPTMDEQERKKTSPKVQGPNIVIQEVTERNEIIHFCWDNPDLNGDSLSGTWNLIL